jgi:uncharacterized membrane protein
MPSRPYWTVFLASILVAAMHLNWAYNELPETVATHFGAGGAPDAWSTRDGWTVSYLVLVGIVSGIFAALVLLMPRLPASVVNIPNRDYWLAPERRATTWRHMGEALLVFGSATNLFDVGIMHLTVVANRSISGELPGSFWVLFTIYMIFTAGWVIWLVRRFKLPKH